LIAPQQLTKNRIVVDTDVVSFIFKKDVRTDFFRPYLLHRTLAISFVTVAQLYYGAYKANWGVSRIAQLENHIKNYVILPYDYLICRKWAQIRSHCETKGYRIESSDAWIAACTLHHDCALATNNGKHFQYIDDLIVICPGFERFI